jgi:hypothetical protein
MEMKIDNVETSLAIECHFEEKDMLPEELQIDHMVKIVQQKFHSEFFFEMEGKNIKINAGSTCITLNANDFDKAVEIFKNGQRNQKQRK